MGRTLDDVLDSLPQEERDAIETRAREILDEVDTLQELRKHLGVGQAQVAQSLHVSQPAVSKVENKHASALTLAAIDNYVAALGGEIDVRITIPGHAPVRLKRLQDLDNQPTEDAS